jgi:hypothetical protein
MKNQTGKEKGPPFPATPSVGAAAVPRRIIGKAY